MIEDVYLDFFFLFFFQAEDGIRDRTVTGVQTCALPISGCAQGPVRPSGGYGHGDRALGLGVVYVHRDARRSADRSEERRVGKECRSRWWSDQCKKKEKSQRYCYL